ncbi:integrase arm-type DNA-binding domain-containing protein [Campylobacter sp. 19-13652]|uniref:tyrosine-type recombinase/integrase n=1 Tax=Campylobacter sp. 19-13652 TaxID=2840180 RepID=UPI001C76DA12|nr:integrase arm-type DNA-binding domain-containing protein [Campylobacter sp. 19-13652]BCX79948.1 integrase [Campylobacter sp. 19-13652]
MLTALQIDKAKPQAKEYKINDSDRLYIEIRPTGLKRWLFVFLTPQGKRAKLTLGRYPALSIADARKKRDEAVNLLNNGIDPREHAKEQEKAEQLKELSTLGRVFNEWSEYQGGEAVTKHRRLRRAGWLLNEFKERPISEIKKADIIRHLELVASELNNDSANRLHQDLNSLYRYACTKDYTEHNIIADFDKRVFLKAHISKPLPAITDETTFSELCRAIYAHRPTNASVKNALKLILHLPLRNTSLISLKWDYVDFDRRILSVPRENMKGGRMAKSALKDDFKLPLSAEVVAILQAQKLHSKNEFIFSSQQGQAHIKGESLNNALIRLGFGDESRGRKQTAHSFRSSFSSIASDHASEHQASEQTIEKALDHAERNEVKAVYSRSERLNELSRLLEWWSGFILSQLEM